MVDNGLEIALELTELGIELRAQRHRREHPDAAEDEVRRVADQWMSGRSQAPDGDGVGRVVSWPRAA